MRETLALNRPDATPEQRAHQQTLLRDAQQALELLAAHLPLLGTGSSDLARSFRAFIRDAFVKPLSAGVTLPELLAALAREPEVEAPPVEPWRAYLPLSIDEFAKADVTLEVWLRPEQVALYLGPTCAPAYARGTGAIWDGARMHRELERAEVPEAEQTVGRLVELLCATVRGLRTAAE